MSAKKPRRRWLGAPKTTNGPGGNMCVLWNLTWLWKAASRLTKATWKTTDVSHSCHRTDDCGKYHFFEKTTLTNLRGTSRREWILEVAETLFPVGSGASRTLTLGRGVPGMAFFITRSSAKRVDAKNALPGNPRRAPSRIACWTNAVGRRGQFHEGRVLCY